MINSTEFLSAEELGSIKFDDSEVTKEPIVAEAEPEIVEIAEPQKEVITTDEKPAEIKTVAPPSKYENESDVQFNIRNQIFLTGQAKAAATTDEEKALHSGELRKLRNSLYKVSPQVEAKIPETTKTTSEVSQETDEVSEAIKTLRDLGVPMSNDINEKFAKLEAQINEGKIAKAQEQQDETINTFFRSRNDIKTDPAKLEQLGTYVSNMFGAQIQSMNKEQLAAALDMSANYLFPRAVNKRSESVANKIDLLDIHGESSSPDISEMSKDERSAYKRLGWSDSEINLIK